MASNRAGIHGFFRWLLGSGGLKRTILIPFSCLILAGFLSGWVLYLRGSRQALFEAVDSLVAETAERVGDSVSDYLAGAAQLASVNSSFFGGVSDPGAALGTMREAFRHELLQRMDIDIVSLGFSNGEYAEAQRMPEGYVRVGEAGKVTGGALVLERVGSGGNPGAVELRRAGYDPRSRPWYIAAAVANGPVFTSPYAIVSTGELAMAAVVPFRLDGILHAVATADLRLAALSSFLSRIGSLRGGLAALADQDGLLLAASDGTAVVAGDGSRIDALRDKSLAGNIFRLAAAIPPDRVFALTDAGSRLRAIAIDRDVGVGQRWRIIVALPEARFTGPLRRTDALSLIVLVAMLGLTLVLAFLAADYTASPLRQLEAAIESLELEKEGESGPHATASPRDIAGRISVRPDEIGRLARAFVNMRERLDESYASVKASLREKEILLKEVHHRVKNNLQIVSSMLSLEEGQSSDSLVSEAFERIQDRVQAMAFVHEDLYRSGDFGSVHMDAYLSRIAESLASVVRGRCEVDILSYAEGMELPLEKALPCGLIVNELLTNALKHAFGGRERGRVEVRLEREGEYCRLSVRDDGIGLPPTDGEQHHGGIGSQLVTSLAQQLRGNLITRTSPSGTSIEMRFPA